VNDEKTGPFSLEQLEAMVANQEISPATLHAKAGMAEWKALSSILPQTASRANRPAATGKESWSLLKAVGVLCVLLVVIVFVISRASDKAGRVKAPPLVSSYDNGVYWLRLKTFTVGKNENEAVGDVITLEMSRFESRSDRSSYTAMLSIRGRQAINVGRGKSVGFRVDGGLFEWTKDYNGTSATTNALGQAQEFLYMDELQSALITALAHAHYVALELNGTLRSSTVELTKENVEWLRAFAQRSVNSDARLFKPVE